MKYNRALFNVCILPAMLYGAETWVLSNSAERKFACAQRRMERFMAGVRLLDKKTNAWFRGVTKVKDARAVSYFFGSHFWEKGTADLLICWENAVNNDDIADDVLMILLGFASNFTEAIAIFNRTVPKLAGHSTAINKARCFLTELKAFISRVEIGC
ncbi:hypothetical protein Y032_0046g1416 [Ancylostoma ceylanicum]|nr:hypothetical protein Y032_0046g1416 [Ancylostoma ceylanicum]